MHVMGMEYYILPDEIQVNFHSKSHCTDTQALPTLAN
jgi:hypothetical protein